MSSILALNGGSSSIKFALYDADTMLSRKMRGSVDRIGSSDAKLNLEDTSGKRSSVGISAAMLPHIFDMFTQVNRTLDRSQGGLGIGLSLVRRLTELHGGQLRLHSVKGVGTTVEVVLPAARILGHDPVSAPREAEVGSE